MPSTTWSLSLRIPGLVRTDTMETLPEIVPVSPAITKNEMAFEWNHEEVKKYLQEVTEKYVGLIVTDENLEDMEKARREIVRFRTSITKFKGDGKRRLKVPADRFARQCDELIAVIEDVEAPIAAQLMKYEDARKARLRESITREYQAKASAMGLDMANWQLDEDTRWYNKTQKWGDTCNAIDRLIKHQLEEQAARWAAEDAANEAQDAAAGEAGEINHKEDENSAETKIRNPGEPYLAVTISFTAKPEEWETVSDLAAELYNRISDQFGVFPDISLEERR